MFSAGRIDRILITGYCKEMTIQTIPTEEYVDVGSVEKVPPGERLDVVINYVGVAIFNLDGAFYAIEDVCTHDGGSLAQGEIVAGCQIECPRHGARFDIRTGAVTRGPAFEPTQSYAVQIVNERIFVEKPV